MATLTSFDPFHIRLGDWRVKLKHRIDALRKSQQRRKSYRRTYAELARLSDRSLGDLGMSRCGIKGRALEATDGS